MLATLEFVIIFKPGENQMKQTVKCILLIIMLGIISYFAIVFIISIGAFLLVLGIFATSLIGIFTIWEKYAKKELMKKEENFDQLKS
jgi:hypothetical protein